MLKGKKGLYILLPLVVVIWGLIIYRVVDAFSAKETTIAQQAAIRPMVLKMTKREKFTIDTIEKDPFLGTLYRPTIQKKARPTGVPKKRDTLVWPSIRYKGLVTDNAAANAVFLIEVNGMAQLLKRKQSASAITLVKGDKTSVLLSYKGKRKQFSLSK